MTIRYTVGMTVGRRSRQVELEAEDALIAALKAKMEQPDALIVYVRKANARGDRRHPHPAAAAQGLPRKGRAAAQPAERPGQPRRGRGG